MAFYTFFNTSITCIHGACALVSYCYGSCWICDAYERWTLNIYMYTDYRHHWHNNWYDSTIDRYSEWVHINAMRFFPQYKTQLLNKKRNANNKNWWFEQISQFPFSPAVAHSPIQFAHFRSFFVVEFSSHVFCAIFYFPLLILSYYYYYYHPRYELAEQWTLSMQRNMYLFHFCSRKKILLFFVFPFRTTEGRKKMVLCSGKMRMQNLDDIHISSSPFSFLATFKFQISNNCIEYRIYWIDNTILMMRTCTYFGIQAQCKMLSSFLVPVRSSTIQKHYTHCIVCI